VRTRAEECGIALRDLEQSILAQDPALEASQQRTRAAAQRPGRAAAPALEGRDGELAVLEAGLDDALAGRGRLFVIAQVALTLVLVIVTSLFVRTLLKLRAQPLGVDRTHLLLVWTAPGQAGRSGERLPDFIHAVLDSVSRVPGVNTATGTNHGLLEGEDGGGASELLNVLGVSPKAGLMVMRDAVSPGFFETAGFACITVGARFAPLALISPFASLASALTVLA